MSELYRIGRRAFLADLGRGTLAIAVFSPLVLACSSDDDTSGALTVVPSAAPTGDATGSSLPTTASTETSLAPSSVESDPASTQPPNQPVAVRRVDLGFVSAYVLVRGREAAVVDTGVEGSAAAIEEALRATSLDWSAVGHVILTHHHFDHAGSIAAVLDAATTATAYAGAADIASIAAPRAVSAVADGEEVFGVQIIGTPGHTAGHISVFDPAGGILIAGDAINNVDELTGPNPQFSADMVTALASAKRLAELPVDTVYFGHGEPIERDAGSRLVDLAASL